MTPESIHEACLKRACLSKTHDDGAQDMTMTSLRKTLAPREPLFGSFAYGTLAALSLTCAAIGSGALGCEIMLAKMTKTPPVGVMYDLPIPFISTPLGFGAVVIALLILWQRPGKAVWPGLGAVFYWLLVCVAWSCTL